MKLTKIVLLSLLIFVSGQSYAKFKIDKSYLKSLRYNHDLNLPSWGPYTKNYIGVSHIPDVEKGLRFDLSVFPGFYRRKVEAPNVTFESGFHPWEATTNLEYFSFRHELEWKDRVYTDISYSKIDENSRAIIIDAVNNTEYNQSIVMHMMGSIHFPSIGPYRPNTPIKPAIVKLPANAVWVDGLDYQKLTYTKKNAQYSLAYDGKLRGEIRDHGFVNGSGVKFSISNGDVLDYDLKNVAKYDELIIRYRTKSDKVTKLKLSGCVNKSIELKPSKAFALFTVKVDKLTENKLQMISLNTTNLQIDGFALVQTSRDDQLVFTQKKWNYVPQRIKSGSKKSLILKYDDVDLYYGIYWDYEDYNIRQFYAEQLSHRFRKESNAHVSTTFKFDNGGHHTNVYMNPINMKPNSKQRIHAYVCYGSLEEVKDRLKKVDKPKLESAYKTARAGLTDYKLLPSGKKYLFSQKRMEANSLCNVVYPVYTQKQYIRHHAPGRWWDSLYSWDSGFIGIGFSQVSAQRGLENLNAYVNEPDEQSAFIHHGTPMPVQHYLYQELWNKTQSIEMLEEYYPKMKRYYDFLMGKIAGSTTRNLKSGLIRTWDYFYNSGGWDDYPPQKKMWGRKQTTTPVVSSAHIARVGKTLMKVAEKLGLENDVKIYQQDVESIKEALNKYSWDEKSGYYGYVEHDKKTKEPIGIFKYKGKVNYNMGLGGVSPIVADICDEHQKKRVVSHLKSEKEIWSKVGLSTVDQSAPYYSNRGYWNGTVWLPHQWFMWKSMLDINEGDFAFKIGKTALETWKRETEKTYNTFEHFVIESGCGAGWHQFSGLSCPIMSWFNAYCVKGAITGGHNLWIDKQKFENNFTKLSAEFEVTKSSSKEFSLIVCMNPKKSYKAKANGKFVKVKELEKGCLSISIPYHEGKIELIVK
jgi:hypothetical protein